MNVLIEKAQIALAQAEQMNTKAKEGNWETVQSIQQEHAELVTQLSIAEVPKELSTELRGLLIKTRALNIETETLANDAKKELVQKKQTLEKSNKMKKALDVFK